MLCCAVLWSDNVTEQLLLLPRLFLYPDEMYAYYPMQLSTPETAEGPGPQTGMRFEFGGMMR